MRAISTYPRRLSLADKQMRNFFAALHDESKALRMLSVSFMFPIATAHIE